MFIKIEKKQLNLWKNDSSKRLDIVRHELLNVKRNKVLDHEEIQLANKNYYFNNFGLYK